MKHTRFGPLEADKDTVLTNDVYIEKEKDTTKTCIPFSKLKDCDGLRSLKSVLKKKAPGNQSGKTNKEKGSSAAMAPSQEEEAPKEENLSRRGNPKMAERTIGIWLDRKSVV